MGVGFFLICLVSNYVLAVTFCLGALAIKAVLTRWMQKRGVVPVFQRKILVRCWRCVALVIVLPIIPLIALEWLGSHTPTRQELIGTYAVDWFEPSSGEIVHPRDSLVVLQEDGSVVVQTIPRLLLTRRPSSEGSVTTSGTWEMDPEGNVELETSLGACALEPWGLGHPYHLSTWLWDQDDGEQIEFVRRFPAPTSSDVRWWEIGKLLGSIETLYGYLCLPGAAFALLIVALLHRRYHA